MMPIEENIENIKETHEKLLTVDKFEDELPFEINYYGDNVMMMFWIMAR